MNMRQKLKDGNLYITIQNLKSKRVRTIIMIFFTFMMSFTIFICSVLMQTMKNNIENTAQRMGADMIIIPGAYFEELKDSLFSGIPCSIYFERFWLDRIQEIEGVKNVSPQLYLQTLSASCCSASVQLIAFEPETDFVVMPWLDKQGEVSELKQGEVIVGNSITPNVGETITFYNETFNVAGKLERTGMGYDNSVFMTFETAKMLQNSTKAKENLNIDDLDHTISMILVNCDQGKSVNEVSANVIRDITDTTMGVYTADTLTNTVSEKVKSMEVYGGMIEYLLLFTTSVAMILIFWMTIHERKREFGIMISMGARRKHIIGIIGPEAFLIGVSGGISGIFGAGAIITIFKDILMANMNISYLVITIKDFVWICMKCLGVSVIVSMIAAICALIKICTEEPVELIREKG